MQQGTFLEQKSSRPSWLAIVLLMHAAAIGALAMSKMEIPVKVFVPITLRDVKIDPPPPENPPEPRAEPLPKSRIDHVPPRVPTITRKSDVVLDPLPNLKIVDPLPGTADTTPVDPPRPLPDPVRRAARIDPASRLQPPYPASEERLGNEGSVTVRLVIGPDGRVREVEKIRATSDAFWAATERHALRHWRFRPATIDGKPVESRELMTVKFQLAG